MKLTIRVDGGRGCGKTTLLARIEDLIVASGYSVSDKYNISEYSNTVNMEAVELEVNK